MDLKAKVTELAVLKDQYQQHYDRYMHVKEQYEDLRAIVTAEMTTQGIKSLESGDWLAVRNHRTDVQLVDEAAAINWLDHNSEVEKDFYIGLKWAAFKPLAKMALKKDGEIPAGVELVSSETVSIKHKDQK